ncbi:aromatic ring-hydroxylating dioxygenase subunit alpha [Herminiimonas contaminans]|uniref:Aromatic ring-hydroxylating dioxygenase subunit alpha n=1 Tax=Herminiimonas contaminans TaxID=1111140 RepID=A0ABS0ETN3_9BURK|nr:aromatic ring-hydroxylating dioxygenase subunit alpha [Herminiimonas contaminans]MBF8178209.1 aromatic ring-hydroxylating dioxygenase subunit alpha [Herminiimonas contaminans]
MTTHQKVQSGTFPLNAWYAAAYDVELKRELLPRTICKQKIVMYRQLNGTAVALEDACWHRLLPLSKGTLAGDTVICGYHGLTFNPSGRCVEMPSQETMNPSACVRSYPVAEKHRLVWLWPGDPTLADESKIPDLHWNDDSEWAGDGQTIHAKCDYRLVIDNLMDLTHETFVHGSTIGHREIAEAPFEVTYDDKFVTVTRWMTDLNPPAFWKGALKHHTGWDGNVDRWQIVRFEAPNTVTIDVGVAKTGTGAPEGDRSQGVNGFVLHTLTPETETTCHYFWSICRNYRLSDQATTQNHKAAVHGIFKEDENILEAQQQAILAHPEREFYNLNIDAGAMWSRRLTNRLIDQEQSHLSLVSNVIPIVAAT